MPYPHGEPRYESMPVPEDYRPIALDTDIIGKCIGLRVAATGNLGVEMYDGTARTILAILAGEVLTGRFKRVTTAGTTIASPTTNIHALVLIG